MREYNGEIRKALAAERRRLRALNKLANLPADVERERVSHAEYMRDRRMRALPADMKCMNESCRKGPLVSRQFQVMDDGRALCLSCARLETGRKRARTETRMDKLPDDMKCACGRGPLVSRQFQIMDDGRALCLSCARAETVMKEAERVGRVIAALAMHESALEYEYED